MFMCMKGLGLMAAVDPGFPQGGCQHMILPNFPENCMKSKEFGRPLDGAPHRGLACN